jgi:hypothetical protein
MSATAKQISRMSDDAVKAKTGKIWKEWFAILDKAGARKMTHQQIAELLNTKHRVGPWWGQMVTVTYERDRGLRDKHQRPDGYQISVSRTLGVPVAELYLSFSDEKRRDDWLSAKGLVVRTAVPNKCLRITWKDKKTRLEIAFYSKGEDKSQVVVTHSKLPDAESAEKMKTFWARALDKMKASF